MTTLKDTNGNEYDVFTPADAPTPSDLEQQFYDNDPAMAVLDAQDFQPTPPVTPKRPMRKRKVEQPSADVVVLDPSVSKEELQAVANDYMDNQLKLPKQPDAVHSALATSGYTPQQPNAVQSALATSGYTPPPAPPVMPTPVVPPVKPTSPVHEYAPVSPAPTKPYNNGLLSQESVNKLTAVTQMDLDELEQKLNDIYALFKMWDKSTGEQRKLNTAMLAVNFFDVVSK